MGVQARAVIDNGPHSMLRSWNLAVLGRSDRSMLACDQPCNGRQHLRPLKDYLGEPEHGIRKQIPKGTLLRPVAWEPARLMSQRLMQSRNRQGKVGEDPSLSLSLSLCCGVIIWSKFGLCRGYYLVQDCVQKTMFVKRHYKIGLSALKSAKFQGLLSGPSWPLLCCNKLGPDNNPYLDQIITQNKKIVCLFLLLKMCWNTCFTVLLNINQNLP